MLDREEERPIDVHFDRRSGISGRCGRAHNDRGGGGRFGAFLVQSDEGLVKHVGNRQIIVRAPRCDAIEVGAARRIVEGAPHAEGAQRRPERDGCARDGEFGQIERDVVPAGLAEIRPPREVRRGQASCCDRGVETWVRE